MVGREKRLLISHQVGSFSTFRLPKDFSTGYFNSNFKGMMTITSPSA